MWLSRRSPATPWTASAVMMTMLRSRSVSAGCDHAGPPAATNASSAKTGPTWPAMAAGTSVSGMSKMRAYASIPRSRLPAGSALQPAPSTSGIFWNPVLTRLSRDVVDLPVDHVRRLAGNHLRTEGVLGREVRGRLVRNHDKIVAELPHAGGLDDRIGAGVAGHETNATPATQWRPRPIQQRQYPAGITRRGVRSVAVRRRRDLHERPHQRVRVALAPGHHHPARRHVDH